MIIYFCHSLSLFNGTIGKENLLYVPVEHESMLFFRCWKNRNEAYILHIKKNKNVDELFNAN